MATRLRISLGLACAIGLLAGFAHSADASVVNTGTARFCDPNSSRVFRPWNDNAYYMLSPGGSFEAGAPGWALTGAASATPGNEPFYIHSPLDQAVTLHPRRLVGDLTDDVLLDGQLALSLRRPRQRRGPGDRQGQGPAGRDQHPRRRNGLDEQLVAPLAEG